MTTISTVHPTQTPAAASLHEREELASSVYGLTAALFALVTVTLVTSFIFQPAWQVLILAAVSLILAILCFALHSDLLTFLPAYESRMRLYNIAFYISLTVMAALIRNIGPLLGAIILYQAILIAASLLPNKTNHTIGVGLVFSLGASVLNIFSPFNQLIIGTPPQAFIVILGLAGLLMIISLSILTVRFISTALGMKLITVSLATALLPLVVISVIQTNFTSGALRDQTNQALELAASQTATNVDDFLSTNQQLMLKEAELPVFISYLNLPPSMRKNSREEKELQLTLESIVAQSGKYLSSIGLINIDGKNVYDSNPLEIGNDEEGTPYFIQTVRTRQVYVSPVLFADNNDPYIYFTAPIRNSQQQIIGVLRARYDGLILQSILEETLNHIGVRSYPVLLDDNNIRIADTLTPKNLYTSLKPLSEGELNDLMAANRLPRKPAEDLVVHIPAYLSAVENSAAEPYFTTQAIPADTTHLMFGTATTLATQPWKVVYLKEQTQLQTLIGNQRNSSVIIAIIFAGLVALLSTLFGNSLSQPLKQLTSTADRIATGDLTASAIIQTSDEIGSLGNAFNVMTQRLRESIYELEDRVQERTAALATQNMDLQNRSQQLLTVSDVAREIATTQELEPLLDTVTRLISERFNFYHVGIFLIDENREYAHLRAANSEGGKKMLARGHKLKVGQVGMVGFVTGTGVPRISTDVGQDAVFFNNPDLPLTRSEMSLPLKVSTRTIGAMDVQSAQSDAFTEEDIKLFTTLADQVAIAIQNNTLFTQTNLALQEAQNLHRQYLNQEWQRESSKRKNSGYVFTTRGTMPVNQEDLAPEVEQALTRGEPILQEEAGEGRASSSMVLPIMLRGEPIGVIHVQQGEQGERKWSENELATVRSVADQVAQALENARLFEQTVRRAERERRALDITSKIRSTNDPQAMIEIAVRELQQALGTHRAQIYIQGNDPNPEKS